MDIAIFRKSLNKLLKVVGAISIGNYLGNLIGKLHYNELPVHLTATADKKRSSRPTVIELP